MVAVGHIRKHHLFGSQPPQWSARGITSYNQQQDGISCGYFVCLFCELYLKQGRPDLGGLDFPL